MVLTLVRTIFFTIIKTHMEELTLRITLTNGKGWKETKSLSLTRYNENKENNIDLVDNIIKELTNQYDNVKDYKKELIENWRP